MKYPNQEQFFTLLSRTKTFCAFLSILLISNQVTATERRYVNVDPNHTYVIEQYWSNKLSFIKIVHVDDKCTTYMFERNIEELTPNGNNRIIDIGNESLRIGKDIFKLINGVCIYHENYNVGLEHQFVGLRNEKGYSYEEIVADYPDDRWNLKALGIKEIQKEEEHKEAIKMAELEKQKTEDKKLSEAKAKGCSGLYIGKVLTFPRLWSTDNWVVTGVDSASGQVTVKSQSDGQMHNGSCVTAHVRNMRE